MSSLYFSGPMLVKITMVMIISTEIGVSVMMMMLHKPGADETCDVLIMIAMGKLMTSRRRDYLF